MMIVNIPEVIPGLQWRTDSTTAIYNCAADARRAELLGTLCSLGIGAVPQQAETRHFRQSGNVWFCAFVYTKALLATFVAARFVVTFCSLGKSLFTNLFSSCKGLNEY